jgi:hypothetical protein
MVVELGVGLLPVNYRQESQRGMILDSNDYSNGL